MTKLNPCPQCGSEPNINTLDDSVSICCGRCDSDDEYFVMSRSASGAINAWNAATSEQPTRALRDEFAMRSPFTAKDITEAMEVAGLETYIDEVARLLSIANYTYADAMIKERSK